MPDSSGGQEWPFSILTTKLYIPLPRLKTVLRPRLIEKLNAGLVQDQNFGHKLTLISAPAGFGKTTLVSEWVAELQHPLPQHSDTFKQPEPKIRIAWLSLDEGDNDPACFLTYLVAALQTITNDIGKGVLGAIQTSQPLTTINESLLASLLNEIAAIPDNFILVLDDYHVIDSEPIDTCPHFSARSSATADAPGDHHPRGSIPATSSLPGKGTIDPKCVQPICALPRRKPVHF